MKRHIIRAFVLWLLLSSPFVSTAAAMSRDAWTLWPLLDLRQDADTDQWSLQLLGPLVFWQPTPDSTLTGVRPLWVQETWTETERSELDLLYPLASWRRDEAADRWSMLNLFTGRAAPDGSERTTLFPIYFSSRDEEGERHHALFPLGGTIANSLGRDRIRFALFPLYSQTEKDGTRATNILWPFFAWIDSVEGHDETGFKLWPLYGQSERAGVYRRKMVLWPFYIRADERLNSDHPRHLVASFPFYYDDRTPEREMRAWCWPFFIEKRDIVRGTQDVWAPWPLVRVLDGPEHHGHRFLPFYSDETWPGNRKRWTLWPIYKREERWDDSRYRTRDRVLFFLYSHLQETVGEETVKERDALWPLYTWERVGERERFFTLSLLEPFFPENRSVDRSLGPLYRLLSWESDPQRGERLSLLWHLAWIESRQADRAMELFPLVSWRDQPSQTLWEFKLVKGLLGLRSEAGKTTFFLLFVPINL